MCQRVQCVVVFVFVLISSVLLHTVFSHRVAIRRSVAVFTGNEAPSTRSDAKDRQDSDRRASQRSEGLTETDSSRDLIMSFAAVGQRRDSQVGLCTDSASADRAFRPQELEDHRLAMAGEKAEWVRYVDNDASGGAAMLAMSSELVSFEQTQLADAPSLGLDLEFEKAGTYYVWLRGRVAPNTPGVGSSCFVGLDGGPPQTLAGFTDAYTWQSGVEDERATVELAKPGKQTLTVSMAETGFLADAVFLTDDPDAVPGDTVSVKAGGSWVIYPPNPVVDNYPLVDTSSPTHVIGTGTPASVTVADLQAAMDASNDIIITFDTGGSPVTLTLTEQLHIPQDGTNYKNIVIDGGGLVTLDGDLTTRIIEKGWKVKLTVQRLTFQNARTAESGAAVNVENWDGSFTALDCTFDNCQTTSPGPDIGGGAVRAQGQLHSIFSNCTFTNCKGSNGGAINSLGSQLTIINCTFTGCEAFGTGGGADQGANGQGGIGGAIYTDGCDQNGEEAKLTVEGCVFDSNSANDHGGACFLYTRPDTSSVTFVNGCTFNNNSVTDSNAAVGFAGAVYFQNADTTIVNSTFSNNSSAKTIGAIFMYSNYPSRIANCTFTGNTTDGSTGGLNLSSGAIYISNCTIANNTSETWPAGVRVGNGATVYLKNSILSNNTVDMASPDDPDRWNGWNINKTVNDGGGNYQYPLERGTTGFNDDLATATTTIADPLLGSLADNGGPTKTMAITSSSPCYNGGTDTSCPNADQRHLSRVNTCDAGAFEVGAGEPPPEPPPVADPPPASGGGGSSDSDGCALGGSRSLIEWLIPFLFLLPITVRRWRHASEVE